MDNDLPVNDNTVNVGGVVPDNAAQTTQTPQTPVVPQEPGAPVTPTSQVSESGLGMEGTPVIEATPQPEMPAVAESMPQQEQAPAVESIAPQVEQLPSIEVPTPVGVQESSPEPVTPQPPVAPVQAAPKNVVDQRTSHEKLVHVQNTSDQLTASADEEEEDFIKHVEEVHTIQ